MDPVFDGIIGFEYQKKILTKIIANRMFSRGFLLCGAGQGKSLLVDQAARAILVSAADNPQYSDDLFTKKSHPDYLTLKPDGGSIKIAQIRDMMQHLSVKPVFSRRRALFIKHADKMTIESANAMLKLLEEPSEDCIIFMSALNASELPETILSRTIQIRCPEHNPSDLQQIIRRINPELSADYAAILAQIAPGGLSKALLETKYQEDYTEVYQFCQLFIQYPEQGYVKGVSGYFEKMTALPDAVSIFTILSALLIGAYRSMPAGATGRHPLIRSLEAVSEYRKAWEANAAKQLCMTGMFTGLKMILSQR